MKGKILFTCGDECEPSDVQLEPWALTYKLTPGSNIKFIATNPTQKFYWALRIDHTDKVVRLFPESSDDFGSIEVYKNDQIIDTID